MSTKIFLCCLLCLGLLLPATARPKLDEVRDPFVLTTPEPESPQVIDENRPDRPNPISPEVRPGEKATRVAEVPPAPDATVTGIVAGSQQQALINFEGQTLLVSVGDKLGAYKVKSITGRKVTLENRGHRYSLEMTDRY